MHYSDLCLKFKHDLYCLYIVEKSENKTRRLNDGSLSVGMV